jgi:hypothetical protein
MRQLACRAWAPAFQPIKASEMPASTGLPQPLQSFGTPCACRFPHGGGNRLRRAALSVWCVSGVCGQGDENVNE